MIFCHAMSVADLKFRKVPDEAVVLIAADDNADEKLRKCNGKQYGVEYRTGRSVAQHRLYFAILRKVFDNQKQFKTEDDLREATLIEIGFSELRERFDESRYRVARSMDFRLSQEDFQAKVFDPSIVAWEDHFGYEPGELLANA